MKDTLLASSGSERPCGRNRAYTYTCMIRDGKGVKRIYWNPRAKVTVRLHKGSTSLRT